MPIRDAMEQNHRTIWLPLLVKGRIVEKLSVKANDQVEEVKRCWTLYERCW